jgi:methylthioxylose transferase
MLIRSRREVLSRRTALTGVDRADLVVACCAGVLVAVAAALGAWLLHRGVPLHVDAPPLGAQWLPHTGPGTVPAVLLALLVILRGPELAARLPWRPLLAVSAATALAWTMGLALIDGWQRGVAGRLTTNTEYLHDVGRVGDVGVMVRTFADRILGGRPESWTTHVAGHPPGALLVFVGLDRIGLPGGAPGALLCVLVGSSAGIAVAVTLRALGTEATARAALPFGVLFPGAIWIGVSADGLFAGVLAWGVALLALGAARPRLDAAALAASGSGGLLLGATLFLSYGLVLAGLLPVAVALTARRLAPLLVAGVGVAAVVAAFAAAGFWWLQGYRQVTIRYYQPGEYGLERPYGYWVWADLACLAVVLGPAGVAGLRRVFTPERMAAVADLPNRGWRSLKSPQRLLCAAAALGVLVADLSGLSKAEVERIWLPFAVWLLAATGLLPARQARWWLAAQTVLALAVNHLLLTTW